MHHYGRVVKEENLSCLPHLLYEPHLLKEEVDQLKIYTFGDPSTWEQLLEQVKQLDM